MQYLRAALACAGAVALSAPRPAGADDASYELPDEIMARFHAAKKWFGMVAELQFDRAPDGALAPRYETLRSRFVLDRDPSGQALGARLPARANGPHEVWVDDRPGVSVRTEEVGIAPVAAEVVRGLVVYRGAVAGGDLIYKLTPTHVDEYLYLREPPETLRRELEFDVGPAVYGLRQAGRLIEVIDRDGAPRLRLSAPLARAADGAHRRGEVRLEGHRIVEEIDLRGLEPPILVDPDWSSTGTMTTAHMANLAFRMPDGRVMAVGGCSLASCPLGLAASACTQVLAISDVWDPQSGTWAAGPVMLTARYLFPGAMLPNNDLVVAGGCTETNCKAVTSAAERYVWARREFIPAGELPHAVGNTEAAAIAGGDVLIPGGCDERECFGDAARYQSANNRWTAVAPMAGTRGYATVTPLPDGTVLVVGGCADVACAQVLADAEVYDPARDAWKAAGTMSSPRAGHTATLLDDGSVLVAGGCARAPCRATTLASADLWKPDAKRGGVFSPGPAMGSPRHHHTATRMDGGAVLMVGGTGIDDLTRATAEVYMPIGRRFLAMPRMVMSRAYHSAAALPQGKVLAGGGCNAATCLPWAEVFSSEGLPADLPDGGVIDAGTEDMAEGPPDWGPPIRARGGPHPRLFRTAVFSCSDDDSQHLACPIAGWPAQDGDFQPSKREFRPPDNNEVEDPVTGLFWELRADRQAFDQAGAIAHCAAKSTPTGGAGAWRLPDVAELATLSVYGKAGPSTDRAFPDTVQTNHWTATPVAGMKMLGWTVKFGGGEIVSALADSAFPVRCVRGAFKAARPPAGQVRLGGPLVAGDRTVRDEQNGLEWEREDDGVRRSWRASLAHCADLRLDGHDDWHLPNVLELLSILDYGSTDAVKIDPAFRSAKGDAYWSGTFYEEAPTLAWSLRFNLGVLDGVTNTGEAYARCVRHLPQAGDGSGCGCALGRRPAPSERGVAAVVVALLAALAQLARATRLRALTGTSRRRRPG